MAQILLAPDTAVWAEKNGGALAILTYDDARPAEDPSQAILSFLHSLYDVAANRCGWPTQDVWHDHA